MIELPSNSNKPQSKSFKVIIAKKFPEGIYKVLYYNDRMEWYLNDKLHRIDNPAIKWHNGNEDWYIEGQRHRENDLPALIINGKSKQWYIQGKRHRLGNPAIEHDNGWEEWYVEDKKHRNNGLPAITGQGKEWYIQGKRHREEGPAIDLSSGYKEWWINGEHLSEENFNKWLLKKQLNKKLTCKNIKEKVKKI